MADTKISALTSATTPLTGTEVLPIVQSGTTVKVANNDLRPKQIQSNATSGVMQIVGPAAAATRVMTIPDANFTAARTDAAQTFTGTQTVLAAATQDAVALAGRAGGTGSYVATITPTTLSASRTVTLPNANTTIPVATQVLTFSGPTAARTITLPDANFTAARTDAANSFTGDQTLSTGNIIQGTAGKGFDFTANSAAAGKTSQLLNVYEEGTFNFTLLGGSGTFTSQTNRYTKIGRTMIVNFDITINTISGSNADTLVGLPYGALAGAAYSGTIGYFSNAANSTTFPGVYVSTTTLYLVGLSSAATSIAQWNALGNGTRITGTIVYATT